MILNNIGNVLQMNQETSVQYLRIFLNTPMDGHHTQHYSVILHIKQWTVTFKCQVSAARRHTIQLKCLPQETVFPVRQKGVHLM